MHTSLGKSKYTTFTAFTSQIGISVDTYKMRTELQSLSKRRRHLNNKDQ
jgi:hypothetical protein